MSSERKSEHAVEVDVLKAHRGQVTQYLSVDLTLTHGSPAIEHGLHLMCIPGHDEVRDECERTGLRVQFLCASSASGATARSPDLALQGMVRSLSLRRRSVARRKSGMVNVSH
jgi:hypothetical protein